MINPIDIDDPFVFGDPKNDPVLADPGAVPAHQFSSESVAHSIRVGNQSAETELDDGTDNTR